MHADEVKGDALIKLVTRFNLKGCLPEEEGKLPRGRPAGCGETLPLAEVEGKPPCGKVKTALTRAVTSALKPATVPFPAQFIALPYL